MEKGMRFVQGKESVFVNVLLLLAIVVFFVPIAMVFVLRFLYRTIQRLNNDVVVLPNNLKASFE
ncbi:MAG: hypothetical protein B6I20_04825 [Bacteroidetes bacterium 4572_117]|nr:MAG: hypothetical protein B6I20_04825 [Bacteroidetes bacterium 4572_117]